MWISIQFLPPGQDLLPPRRPRHQFVQLLFLVWHFSRFLCALQLPVFAAFDGPFARSLFGIMHKFHFPPATPAPCSPLFVVLPPATRHWLLFIFCAFCILFLLFIYECVCVCVRVCSSMLLIFVGAIALPGAAFVENRSGGWVRGSGGWGAFICV